MSPEDIKRVQRIKEVFFPVADRRTKRVQKNGYRFAHYTSAEVATRILTNREIWMRNSLAMNDFMELQYGARCLGVANNGKEGEYLRSAVDACFPGVGARLTERFHAWLPGIKADTYLTCVSEHPSDENAYGRLSMWRAYGGQTGVALVLNTGPFFAITDALGAYSSPVSYFTEEQFLSHFVEVADSIKANSEFVKSLGQSHVENILFEAMRFAIQCTKHPGFHEEQEWRVIRVPSMHTTDLVTESVEVVRGVPQRISKLKLKNVPERNVLGLEIPEFLERVIIGPTKHPQIVFQAFWTLLSEAGVPNPEKIIHISDIPLRQE